MSEKHALYIIGEPGVGKSTLMGYLTKGQKYEETSFPFPFRYYENHVVEIGKRRNKHSGTDALAMDVQTAVEKYLEAVQPKMILAEGDRLANGTFFAELIRLGYNLRIVVLIGPDEAHQRRVAQRGFRQDDTWLKSRKTKVLKLASEWGPYAQLLHARHTPEELANLIASPVADAFRGN